MGGGDGGEEGWRRNYFGNEGGRAEFSTGALQEFPQAGRETRREIVGSESGEMTGGNRRRKHGRKGVDGGRGGKWLEVRGGSDGGENWGDRGASAGEVQQEQRKRWSGGAGGEDGDGGGGAAIWRQRRPEAAATAVAARRLHDGNQRTRQGEAADTAAGTAAARGGAAAVAAAVAAVGLPPCSSLSSHLR